MKTGIGALMIVGGVVLGLYVGIYICLVGGIVDIIGQIKAPELSATIVAWGVVKILCCSFAGVISAYALIIPGLAIGKS